MKLVTLYLTPEQIRELDRIVHEKGYYPNRNECIRTVVRDLINTER